MTLGCVKFEVTEHSNASPEDIINVMDNWQDLPKYWHGMREITESRGGMFNVRFAFPGEGKMSFICDRESTYCTENYHSGPFTGFKRVELARENSGSRITAKWEVQLSFKLIFMKRFIVNHFRQGTENALKRISEEAERSRSEKAKA